MKTAWIVDDDEEMIRALRLMLQLLDYRLRAFLNARDAVKILNYGEQPDVLILDINMPEVSGIDLLEFIRRNEAWRAIPIVMLSTEYSPPQIEQALALGADAYVCKPVTLEELETAIQQAIAKHATTE